MNVQHVAIQRRGIAFYCLLYVFITISSLILLLVSASLVTVRFGLSQQVVRGDDSSHHGGEVWRRVEGTWAGSEQYEIEDLGNEDSATDPTTARRQSQFCTHIRTATHPKRKGGRRGEGGP